MSLPLNKEKAEQQKRVTTPKFPLGRMAPFAITVILPKSGQNRDDFILFGILLFMTIPFVLMTSTVLPCLLFIFRTSASMTVMLLCQFSRTLQTTVGSLCLKAFQINSLPFRSFKHGSALPIIIFWILFHNRYPLDIDRSFFSSLKVMISTPVPWGISSLSGSIFSRMSAAICLSAGP